MSSNEAVGACGNCGSLSPWRCGCPGNDLRPWREQMEDLASHVWTNRKASWEEVCDETAKFTGKKVPEFDSQGMLTEDALRHLSDEEVQKVLVGLGIDSDECGDLCPECFALPGECKPTCGQHEDPEDALYDPPSTEGGVEELLEESLTERLSDLCGGRTEPRWEIRSFKDAEVMTDNKGLVLKLGGREFQITVVRSK